MATTLTFDPAGWVRQAQGSGLKPMAVVTQSGERGVLLSGDCHGLAVPSDPDHMATLFDYLAATGRLVDTRFRPASWG